MGALFGTTVPANLNNNDGNQSYSLGTQFRPNVNGNATHGEWYFPTTSPSAPVTIGIYRNSDNLLLGSATFPGGLSGGRHQVAFNPVIPLVALQDYTVALWTPDAYTSTGAYFATEQTRGDIYMPPNAGRFLEVEALTQPTSTFNSAAYFPDFIFSTGAGTTPFTKDYVTSWRVLASFTKDYTTSWRVLAAFTKDYATSWRVRNAFTRDYATSWAVRNSFTRDYAVSWDVLAGTAFSRDYPVSWRVFGSFTQDYAVAWRVLNAFSRDYAVAWNVLADTAFTRDYPVSWAIRNAFERDHFVRWRVLSDAPPTPFPADVAAMLEDYVVARLTPERVTAYLK